MKNKITHFLYVPLIGLGLYQGYRGKRWMCSRIKIFKQFVLPSLLNQTNKDFTLWVSVRFEDRHDKIIKEFKELLESKLKVVFTYAGVCFWDDKYEDNIAYERLVHSIHGSVGDLLNAMGECDTVLMTIQPSDDVYHTNFVQETQDYFKNNDVQVYGYAQGYVMDYINRRLSEWNPTTTPPFYTIKFDRETFVDPFKHIKYIGPYKSHEYVKNFLKADYADTRGFIVGTHSANISTIFDHPYTGHEYLGDNVDRILNSFGLRYVGKLKISFSLMNIIFRKLPYGIKRKLRYWAEKKGTLRPIFSIIYNILRA